MECPLIATIPRALPNRRTKEKEIFGVRPRENTFGGRKTAGDNENF